jgi:hypothetical protein
MRRRIRTLRDYQTEIKELELERKEESIDELLSKVSNLVSEMI